MIDKECNYMFEKKTKIIATLGPSSGTKEEIKNLIKQGMNVARINMSHGNFEEQAEKIVATRAASKELGIPIGILLDTKGPEIRIHTFKDDKKYKFLRGKTIFIETGKEIIGDEKGFSVTYKDMPSGVKVGQEILADDGKLSMIVKKIEGTKIWVETQNTHFLSNKKAINIPGADLLLPFVSDYDRESIEWGLKQNVDYIAASFVNSKKDIDEIRAILIKNKMEHVQVIPKIESLKAINNLNEIAMNSDGILLARGDLGVEIPFKKVPFYQKLIINKCKYFGKPIIIATQMLESMAESPRPTRAEATDVYFAALSGVDSTMLSGESANGQYPIESINAMSALNREAEKHFDYIGQLEHSYAYVPTLNAETAYAVSKHAILSKTKYIIALSKSGALIKALSRFRPNGMILGVTGDVSLETYFGIWYGVYMNIVNGDPTKLYDNDAKLMEIAKNSGAKKGDEVMIVTAKNFRTKIVN